MLQEGGYEVVAQAGDGSELMQLVREHRPDLAVIDIRMPPAHRTEGLEAARSIREEFPETAILLLSAHVEVTQAMTLLASGRGSGYLLKSRIGALDEFLDAVDRVSRGGSVVDPVLVQELVLAREVGDPLEELTSREREVLALMAEGRSNAGISRRLWISGHGREARAQHYAGNSALPRLTTITAACSQRSGSSRLIRRATPARSGGEHPANCRRRQLRLGKKSQGRTLLDQVGKPVLVVGRDQDHIRDRKPGSLRNPACQGQAALWAEVDVNEGYVRVQFGDLRKRVSCGPGSADYFDALLLEQDAHFLPEARIIIDDQTADRHITATIARTASPHMYASPHVAYVRQPTRRYVAQPTEASLQTTVGACLSADLYAGNEDRDRRVGHASHVDQSPKTCGCQMRGIEA